MRAREDAVIAVSLMDEKAETHSSTRTANAESQISKLMSA
jgi:hypothetical protein